MEVEHYDNLPENESVVCWQNACQTCEAKWLCLDNVYQKFHRPNYYDIGGTYIQDVADYCFTYKTEQVHNVHLLHIFVCNRQESVFNIGLSRSTDIRLDKRNGVIFLTPTLKEHRFQKTKEMSQTYLTTYSFSTIDIDLMKDRKLFIAVSFNTLETKGLNQNLINQVKLNHDFGALLEDPIAADFVIESADGAKFKVHKILLEAHSEVFKAMLKEETAESQNGCVKLIDVGREDLHFILECIYTGTIKDLENCNCFNMLMLADRYNIRGLREISQHALVQQLCIDNAIEIFIVADLYNSDVLKIAALKFIKNNPAVMNSDTFREINNADLMRQLCEYLIPT